MPAPGAAPRPAPRFSPLALITLAVVANLLIASSVALAVAPVATSRAMLDTYDGLPGFLRDALGDVDEGERGPLGRWLAGLFESAMIGSPKAQLTQQLDLRADLPVDEWVPMAQVNLTWRNYGAPLDYHVAATPSATPPELRQQADLKTNEPSATLALPRGEGWVHVQAFHGENSGPVTTLGPFRSDPTPPSAPVLAGGPLLNVGDYHFQLAWSGVDAPSGITSYVVERQHATGWQTVAIVDGETRTHQERNRPNGEHLYRVRAESGAGLLTMATAAEPLTVRVNAQGNLQEPGYGNWYRGVNAIYDSLLYTYDIHDPTRYATIDDLKGGTGGISASDYTLYTGDGWGITLDDANLRHIVADTLGGTLLPNGEIVGGERNTLTIGLLLFEWLSNAVSYDFGRLTEPDQRLLRATETLAAGGGICGDLTALYVTMMRIAGVPARPVHGYLISEGGASGGVGGFHMWPEIYVGGVSVHEPGEGWIPLDVSGVRGEYRPEDVHIYFGVANPNYLQLGIQIDLGDESLPPQDNGKPHPRNLWNVWANLGWSYRGDEPPPPAWTADGKLTTISIETGSIWFTPGTLERVYCRDQDDGCRGSHTAHFQNVHGRSVRQIDIGADFTWSTQIEKLEFNLRYPEHSAPTQVMMFTPYERGPDCQTRASSPPIGEPEMGLGQSLVWTVPGDATQCPS